MIPLVRKRANASANGRRIGQLQVYAPLEECDAIRAVAKALGISVSQLLRVTVADWTAQAAADMNLGVTVVRDLAKAGLITEEAPPRARRRAKPQDPPDSAKDGRK